ncbi:MAG: 5-methyltetrahydropteroyltriglutamate--homocysteine S-methyltransferase [Deltaproteobacteria bacterium]|nr:5-methyltetrahydropteroyltriglutamate--homocysteine S-methyltransferase [Deltaproteobacteria bacterium]
MQKHILGFPRMGAKRELKKALENYWKGTSSRRDLEETCAAIKRQNWTIQKNAGLSWVTTGDFSLYDHILDITAMIGAVPDRFSPTSNNVDIDTYFRMARGDASANIPPMEMTKWFNTNYHYIVPEISGSLKPTLSCRKIIEETGEAQTAGFNPKPVLVGPITYLSLSKSSDNTDCWNKLEGILAVYAEVIAELGSICEWVQMDEPILCADIALQARKLFKPCYEVLNKAAGKGKLMLTTYFDTLDDNLDLALSSGCSGLHADLVMGKNQLNTILERLPKDMFFSAGIIDGRNVWKTDLRQALHQLENMKKYIGEERLMIASSCSLLHSPMDLKNEKLLDPELKSWMAFAVQKCHEIGILGRALAEENCQEEMQDNAKAIISRKTSVRIKNDQVRERCAKAARKNPKRKSPYSERKKAQSWLKLPLLPTTTIGSFPQTAEIRQYRRRYKNSEMTRGEYDSFLKNKIREIVKKQEDLNLDVLVHGEPERNDMVEYFGQQMEGFCFTENGWVQSYGSRCVKPPIIFGDVSRPNPMTVEWIDFAQSLTEKPVKGMLTGALTILCWSFVRNDLERSQVCRQIALAVKDEVRDLEAAGIRIIQIDEAALSEGLPIKQKDRNAYLRWAVDAFKLATSEVADATQIHTHMCYSEFNDIIDSIAAMDADVISIESSRSRMKLLETFRTFNYPNEIGPGVYDIHSPRVPSVEEIQILLKNALAFIPRERLWVNPDCGLKTRDWPETVDSLKNMAAAANLLRKEFDK